MGKCTCTLSTGFFLRGTAPPLSEENALSLANWPLECSECGKILAHPKEAANVADFRANNKNPGIKAICSVCDEICSCFFCTCGVGDVWPYLRRKYTKIGLGNLTELLSPEARDLLIEKVDEWMEEDLGKEEEDARA